MRKVAQDLVCSKKGISSVVSIALVILVTVGLAALLYPYIINLGNDVVGLSPSECIDMQTKKVFSVNTIETCYNEITEDVQIKISRRPYDSPIDEITFTLNYDDGNSYNWGCNDCGDCQVLSEGEQKKYYIESETMPTSITVAAQNCNIEELELKAC